MRPRKRDDRLARHPDPGRAPTSPEITGDSAFTAAPHLGCGPGTVYVQGETRGTQSVCTLPSWHVRTKCVHQNAHAFGPWCGGEHGACRPVPTAWRGRRPRGRPLRPPMAADCCPRHLPSRQRYASLETNQTLEDSDAGGERCWGEGETIEGPSNVFSIQRKRGDSTSFPLNGEPRRRNGPRALSLKALLGPGASHGRLPRGVLRCLGV